MNYLNGGEWKIIAEFTEVESGKRSDRPQLAATGPSAVKGGTRARSLRRKILARPPSTCAHDHDRLRIPPAPPSGWQARLRLAEEPFDYVSRAIQIWAEADQVFAISFRRNVCPCSLLSSKLPDPVRIVSAIREQHRLRRQRVLHARSMPSKNRICIGRVAVDASNARKRGSWPGMIPCKPEQLQELSLKLQWLTAASRIAVRASAGAASRRREPTQMRAS